MSQIMSIKPTELANIYLEDALVYGVAFDALSQTAIISVEVDAEFHKDFKSLSQSAKEFLVDIVFSHVEHFEMTGIPERPSSWALDEKPHDLEISCLEITRPLLSRDTHDALFKCSNGPKIRIRFRNVALRLSDRKPGVVHDYAAENQ